MPVFRLPALAIVAALLFLPVSAAPVPGDMMSMTEHQSITIAPGALLTYDSVSDSRCPPDVQCVVAGKVVYSFSLTVGATREQFALTPTAPAFTSIALQGKQITLADAAPPLRATVVNIKIITP